MNGSIDDIIYINTHQMIDRMGKDEWRGFHGATRSISLDPVGRSRAVDDTVW